MTFHLPCDKFSWLQSDVYHQIPSPSNNSPLLNPYTDAYLFLEEFLKPSLLASTWNHRWHLFYKIFRSYTYVERQTGAITKSDWVNTCLNGVFFLKGGEWPHFHTMICVPFFGSEFLPGSHFLGLEFSVRTSQFWRQGIFSPAIVLDSILSIHQG